MYSSITNDDSPGILINFGKTELTSDNIKRITKKQDSREENDYFIDPAKGDISNYVKYDADMYSINLGKLKCKNNNDVDASDCITKKDYYDRFRVNPNKKDWDPDTDIYTLAPKSNQLSSKSELIQKQHLKIYPHMYSAQTDLIKEQNKPWKAGIEFGGVDYPIPMNFQLRYLQDPKLPSDTGIDGFMNGIDYDARVKQSTNNSILIPDEYRSNMNSQYTDITNAGSTLCNSQRAILDQKSSDHRRLQGRTAGIKDVPDDWLQEQQNKINRRQQNDLNDQVKYTGYEQYETLSTRNKPQFTSSVKSATSPNPAYVKSGFFALGPPLPPPNPMLLSAISSDLLAREKLTGNSTIDSSVYTKSEGNVITANSKLTNISNKERQSIDEKQAAFDSLELQRESDAPVAPVSRHATIASLQKSDANPNKLGTDHDWEIEKFTNQIQTERQYLAEPEERNHTKALFLKQQAKNRIQYQMAHLKRLLPYLRQKQIHSKDVSHMIDINLTTLKIQEIQKKLEQLELLQNLLDEEIIKTLKPGENLPSGPPQNELYEHYFNDLTPGIGMFYNQDLFKGNKKELKYGFYDSPQVGGIGNGNLRSFKIPQNTVLYLYTRANRGGIRLKYSGPTRISQLPITYQRSIAGIELVESIPPYDAICYTGKSYQGNIIPLRVGFYDYPSLGGVGMKRLASFRLPAELFMTLYSRPNKQGNSITYKGPIELPFLPIEWVNNVSGIEIQLKK